VALAGDAVVIEPVSSRIPCKQGIFQGILEIQPPKWQPAGKKPLRRSHFLENSRPEVSGKIFPKTAIPTRRSGKSGEDSEM